MRPRGRVGFGVAATGGASCGALRPPGHVGCVRDAAAQLVVPPTWARRVRSRRCDSLVASIATLQLGVSCCAHVGSSGSTATLRLGMSCCAHVGASGQSLRPRGRVGSDRDAASGMSCCAPVAPLLILLRQRWPAGSGARGPSTGRQRAPRLAAGHSASRCFVVALSSSSSKRRASITRTTVSAWARRFDRDLATRLVELRQRGRVVIAISDEDLKKTDTTCRLCLDTFSEHRDLTRETRSSSIRKTRCACTRANETPRMVFSTRISFFCWRAQTAASETRVLEAMHVARRTVWSGIELDCGRD